MKLAHAPHCEIRVPPSDARPLCSCDRPERIEEVVNRRLWQGRAIAVGGTKRRGGLLVSPEVRLNLREALLVGLRWGYDEDWEPWLLLHLSVLTIQVTTACRILPGFRVKQRCNVCRRAVWRRTWEEQRSPGACLCGRRYR